MSDQMKLQATAIDHNTDDFFEKETLPQLEKLISSLGETDPTLKNTLIDLLDPKKTLNHQLLDNQLSVLMMEVLQRNEEGIIGALKACKTIEQKRALVNAQDCDGRTALIHACQMGAANVVNLLIPFAEVNQPDNKGQRPLHFAVLYMDKVEPTEGRDKTQIIQCLLTFDANDLPNEYNVTPRQIASVMPTEDARKILASLLGVAAVPQTYTPALAASTSSMTQKMDNLSLGENKASPEENAKTTTTTTATDTTPEERRPSLYRTVPKTPKVRII